VPVKNIEFVITHPPCVPCRALSTEAVQITFAANAQK